LTLTGRFRGDEITPSELAAGGFRTFKPRLLVRSAVASLIAGIGLLNVADASWAHAIGVVCLFGFIVAGFVVIVSKVLAQEPTPR
jgi:hypothetical protein